MCGGGGGYAVAVRSVQTLSISVAINWARISFNNIFLASQNKLSDKLMSAYNYLKSLCAPISMAVVTDGPTQQKKIPMIY